MTSNVRFTFGVGDTTWAIYTLYGARQIELVTLNTMFSVDFPPRVRSNYQNQSCNEIHYVVLSQTFAQGNTLLLSSLCDGT